MEMNKNNQLTHFYKVATNCNETVENTNDIQWIKIFEGKNSNDVLGISQSGQWIFKDAKKFYVLENSKTFLCCAKLLETPYLEIKMCIEEKLKNIITKERICISSIFPFFEIVYFAFDNLFDDYWFNLAWIWYEKLCILERCKLIHQLETISSTKKISQRNRQKASKEIKILMAKSM